MGPSTERRRGVGGHHRAAALGALVLVAAALSACGLGDKAALEDRITAAPARLEGRVTTGTITVETRFVSAPTGGGLGAPAGAPGLPAGEAPEIPEGGITLGTQTRSFVLDLAGSRAALSAADGTAGAPEVLFEDLVLFGRRGGIPADDARPWVRLALDDVGESAGELVLFDGSAASAVVALHPAVVVDLVAGALTGSIETVGTETIGGVETTHYAVNIAVDKALEDVRRSRYPEDRRELVERLIELLGVDGDVHPADVWLDADGDVRRFSVALRQRPLTKVEFALVVTVELGDDAPGYDASPPTPQEVLSVDSVVRFISTVTGGATGEDEIPPSVAATLGTVPTADPDTGPDVGPAPATVEGDGS